MSNNQLKEHDKYWELPFHKKKVLRCYLDYSFGINLGENTFEFEIRINNEFLYSEKGTDFYFNPEQPETLCPILSIHQKEIFSAVAYKDGSLCLVFQDKSKLFVKSDPNYEAWEINEFSDRENRLMVVSIPGGNLAIWK